jgi:hypothetical protein
MLGPIIVPGKPLDPALGLPSAVFRVRAWPQWVQVAFGGVLLVAVVAGSSLGRSTPRWAGG